MALRRQLGIFHLTLASVTGMVGSGWLFGEFYASSIAGPASIFSWIIGSMMILSLALVYAELGGKIPLGGAAARYPEMSHGKSVSAINGWALFLGYVSTPPLEAVAAVTYMNFMVGGLISRSGNLTMPGIGLAFGFLVVFFVINRFGVKAISSANSYIALAKIFIPTMTAIVLALTFFSIKNFTAGGFFAEGTESIFVAIPNAGIVFSFLGFRQAIELSGEAKNPGRTVPIAIILGLVISAAIYILVQVAFIGSMTWNGIRVGDWSALATSGFSSGPMVVLATSLGIGWLAIILLGDGVVSPLGTAAIYETTTSRVVYALGDMGYFPRFLSKLNKYSVPAIALVFDLVLMAIFLIPAPSWQSLVSLNSDLSIIAYASGPVALIVLRKIGTASREGYFTLPMAGIISPIAYVAAILLIYWSGYPTTLYMTAVALAGLAIFGYLLWKKSATMVDLKNSIWFILTLVSVPIISYVGSMNLDIIQFPFDVFLMAGIAVVFYFVGINTHLEPYEVPDYAVSGTIAQEQE